jgi:hypothetical protein
VSDRCPSSPPAARGLPLLLQAKEAAIYKRAALFRLRVEIWRTTSRSRRSSWRILLLAGRHGASCACPGAASRVVV